MANCPISGDSGWLDEQTGHTFMITDGWCTIYTHWMGSCPISLDIGLILLVYIWLVLRTRPNTAQTCPISSDIGRLPIQYDISIPKKCPPPPNRKTLRTTNQSHTMSEAHPVRHQPYCARARVVAQPHTLDMAEGLRWGGCSATHTSHTHGRGAEMGRLLSHTH